MVREDILKKMKDDDDNQQEAQHPSDDHDDDVHNNINNNNSSSNSSSNNNNHRRSDNLGKLAYDQEQVELRNAFLSSNKDETEKDSDDEPNANNDDDDDDGNDWLKKKSKTTEDSDDEIEKDRLEEIANLTSFNNNDDKDKTIDPKGEIDDGEKFLYDFIKDKKWVDREFHTHEAERDGNFDKGYESETSINDLDKTDDFESRYNFRFEEATTGHGGEGVSSGAGLSVVGYSRTSLSDTVRRKDESRKQKRKQRKERKLVERKAKEEKLKRLKNAKKEEMEERISQIKNVLSDKASEIPDEAVDQEIVAKLMDGDFDPDKFEDLMSKMYSDDFYEQEDTDWKNDVDVKRSFKKSGLQDDKEVALGMDDREGDSVNNDEEIEYDDSNMETENDNANEDYDDEDYEYDHNDQEKEGGNKLEAKLNDRMMEELYKLDYEDIIGDMPTRFKYRQVEPNRYGLRPEEILFSRDTTLTQFVSLKRMVPYIEEGEFIPGTKRRKRFRDMAKADYEEFMEEDDGNAPDSTHNNQSTTDDGEPQKKQRRRQKKGKKKSKEESTSSAKDNNDAQEKVIETKVDETEDAKKTTSSSSDFKTDEKELVEKELTDKKKARKKKGKKVKKYDSTNGDKRKGKKKKSESKTGISESRLASYGF
jgi:protein KRI1